MLCGVQQLVAEAALQEKRIWTYLNDGACPEANHPHKNLAKQL
jgi:hypothetical protein